MSSHATYTRKQMACAVNLAALMGWLFVAAPVAFTSFNPGFWVATALVGLPIAFATCWLIGAPILWWISRKNKKMSWSSAALWGAIISALIYLLYIAFLVSSPLFRGPNSRSQIGGGEYTQSVNGVLTPYGWQLIAVDFVIFAMGSMAIALVIRWILGSGQLKA